MVILPTKFVDEMRNAPEDELSSIIANTDVSRCDLSLLDPLLTESKHRILKGCILQPRFLPKAIFTPVSYKRD